MQLSNAVNDELSILSFYFAGATAFFETYVYQGASKKLNFLPMFLQVCTFDKIKLQPLNNIRS